MSNRDTNKGTAKDTGGKLKEAAGDLTGNDRMKSEGQGDQAEGKVQKGVGKAKDALKGKS